MSHRNSFLLILFIFLLATPAFFYFSFDLFYSQSSFPHLFLGKIDFSNKTKSQIDYLLAEQTDFFLNKKIELFLNNNFEKKSFQTTFKELGVEIDQKKTREDIFNYGKDDDFLENFKKRIKIFFFEKKFSPIYQIKGEKLEKFIAENFASIESKAKDAQIKIEKGLPDSKAGEIKIIPEEYGKIINRNSLIENLEEATDFLEAKDIELFFGIDQPEIKIEQINQIKKNVEDILAKSLILKWQEKTWPINKETLGQWIDFEKKTTSKINEFDFVPKINEFDFVPKINRPKILIVKINQDAIKNYLNDLYKEINLEAKNAKFEMDKEKVAVFEKSQAGRELEIEKCLSEIVFQLETEKNQIEIELMVKTTFPEIVEENINDFGIKELIGQGISDFKGSPSERIHNIKNGVKRLNGILIKPGEIFSLVNALGKVGPEQGYLPGLVIKQGKTVPEYGGGLCQVATTVFRAAIYSGLPIIERKPHAYRVPYYEPAGMDSTIYGPHPDLKFENNTPAYLLVQARVEGIKVIFEFYGTSDKRKVEVSEPRIFNITDPAPTVYIETKNLAKGEKKWQEKPHKGADAEFTRKIFFPDGQVKEEIFKSHYKAWQGVVYVGI